MKGNKRASRRSRQQAVSGPPFRKCPNFGSEGQTARSAQKQPVGSTGGVNTAPSMYLCGSLVQHNRVVIRDLVAVAPLARMRI